MKEMRRALKPGAGTMLPENELAQPKEGAIQIERYVDGELRRQPYGEPLDVAGYVVELSCDERGRVVLKPVEGLEWRILSMVSVDADTAQRVQPGEPLQLGKYAGELGADGYHLGAASIAELCLPGERSPELRVSAAPELLDIAPPAQRGGTQSQIIHGIKITAADAAYYRSRGMTLPLAIVQLEDLEHRLARLRKEGQDERVTEVEQWLSNTQSFRGRYRIVDKDAARYTAAVSSVDELESPEGRIRPRGRGAMGEIWRVLDISKKDFGVYFPRAVKVVMRDMAVLDTVYEMARKAGVTILEEDAEAAKRAYLEARPGDAEKLEQRVEHEFRTGGNQSRLGRFAQEQKLMNVARGEHVVTVREGFSGVDGNGNEVGVIVMDYVDGDSLNNLVGELTEQQLAAMLRDALKGLGELHRVNIAHCDVKPDNIMVQRSADGEPAAAYLIDLGVATELPMGELRGGTKQYLSPEAAQMFVRAGKFFDTTQENTKTMRTSFLKVVGKPEHITAKADAWQWGATTYDGYTRKKLGRAYGDLEKPEELLWYRIGRHTDPRDIEREQRELFGPLELPHKLEEALMRATHPDPEKRWGVPELLPLVERAVLDFDGAYGYMRRFRELLRQYGVLVRETGEDGKSRKVEHWERLVGPPADPLKWHRELVTEYLDPAVDTYPDRGFSDFSTPWQAAWYRMGVKYALPFTEEERDEIERKTQGLIREATRRVWEALREIDSQITPEYTVGDLLPLVHSSSVEAEDILKAANVMFGKDYKPGRSSMEGQRRRSFVA